MNTILRPAVRLLSVALLLASSSCLYRFVGPPPEPQLEELLEWMSGSFSSLVQSEALPADYLDIHLEMTPIWPERTDGPWLYVEQAAANALDRPYRQRVYRLVATPGELRSDVYELPGDPLRFAGAYRDTFLLDGVGPADLELREGCSIHLVRDHESYRGSTAGRGCTTSWGDASYATSEVSVTPDTLRSWDRGFNDAGEQVWGAVPGPYVFDRVE